MLTKLLKHDLRGTGRIMVPVWVGSTALAALAAIMSCFYRSYQWDDRHPLSILTDLFGLTAVLCMMALLLVCVFVCARRFYDLLGDAGYVYFTLPVKPWQHIAAKLVNAVIWTVGTILVMAVQMGLMSGPMNGAVTFSMDVAPGHPGWLALYSAEAVLLILESFAVGYLGLYLCIAIGAQWPQHRLLVSVVTYFVLSFAGQVLMIVTAGLTFRHLTKIVDSVEISVQQNPLPTMAAAWGGALLILAAIGAILWAVTQYFIGKKLNLG